MKRITKKQFNAALRSDNITEVHRLFVLETGRHNQHELYLFIKNNAPTIRIARRAYEIAFPRRHYNEDYLYHGKHGYFKPLPKQAARLYFEEEFNRPKDSYTKVAICGLNWLYAASPIYRLADYNKGHILEIKGNEKTCEILARKYGNINKSKL